MLGMKCSSSWGRSAVQVGGELQLKLGRSAAQAGGEVQFNLGEKCSSSWGRSAVQVGEVQFTQELQLKQGRRAAKKLGFKRSSEAVVSVGYVVKCTVAQVYEEEN